MTTQQAIIILAEVKAERGRMFKREVHMAWMYGNYRTMGLERWEGELQCIRNEYGPSWLHKAKVPSVGKPLCQVFTEDK